MKVIKLFILIILPFTFIFKDEAIAAADGQKQRREGHPPESIPKREKKKHKKGRHKVRHRHRKNSDD